MAKLDAKFFKIPIVEFEVKLWHVLVVTVLALVLFAVLSYQDHGHDSTDPASAPLWYGNEDDKWANYGSTEWSNV
jgi:hypothetical protein